MSLHWSSRLYHLHSSTLFLDTEQATPVIILSQLHEEQGEWLLEVLQWNEQAGGWTLVDLRGLNPSLCNQHIFWEDESKPIKETQRRLNLKIWEVIKEEILKWLNAKIIYHISNSQWVSPVYVVLNKTRLTVYINYQKLNSATTKDQLPLPFIN